MALNQKEALIKFLQIADVIGVIYAYRLYKMFEGEQIYFPSFKTLFKIISRRDLVKDIKRKGVKRKKRNDREIIKQAEMYNIKPVGIYKKIEKYKRLMKKNPDIEFL